MNLSVAYTAASPCLRSRLASGVSASAHHLKLVENAENFLRHKLVIDDTENIRFRILPKRQYRIEVDAERFQEASSICDQLHRVLELDFESSIQVKLFQTGSVAAINPFDHRSAKAT